MGIVWQVEETVRVMRKAYQDLEYLVTPAQHQQIVDQTLQKQILQPH